jgi:uncharacterized caspase-like protein
MSAVGMHRAAFVTFAAFLALAAPSTAEAKRVALVVGINIYDNLAPGQQLQKARNDARAVAATFKETGFQVILAEDAGRVAFLRAWQRFLDTVAPGDVTALYFSGHGVETPDRPRSSARIVACAGRIAALLVLARVRKQQPRVCRPGWRRDCCGRHR